MNLTANFTGTNFRWSTLEDVSGDLCISDDPNCSYQEFVKVMTGKDFELVPPQYAKMSSHFVSSSFAAPLMMPKSNLKNCLSSAERLLAESFEDIETQDYFATWSKIYIFLQKMSRASIDIASLEVACQSVQGDNSRVLRSFEPDSSGFAKKIKYSTCGSMTGRLKVIEGPQILTAPHEIRTCIRSSFEDGQILMVDFVSVEPRVAMFAAGLQPPEDVYSDLLEEFPKLNRKAAKLVTLAALYGSSANKLSEIVGDISEARKSVSFVRSHFRVESLERKLSEQAEKGLVRNVFGRPLREATKNPRIRTNHFLQSSAAELCALLFAELTEKCSQGVKPLFVIHDALIVDVNRDATEYFTQTCKNIKWKENKMPVKIEKLSPI